MKIRVWKYLFSFSLSITKLKDLDILKSKYKFDQGAFVEDEIKSNFRQKFNLENLNFNSYIHFPQHKVYIVFDGEKFVAAVQYDINISVSFPQSSCYILYEEDYRKIKDLFK
jgi:hypothetical protein